MTRKDDDIRPSVQLTANLPEKEYVSTRDFFRRAGGIASMLAFLELRGNIPPSWWSGKRVVELGCGSGSGLWVFRILGSNIIGVDSMEHPEVASFAKSPLVADVPYEPTTSLSYLTRQPTASVDALCGFNVESDVWEQSVRDEAARVLTSGGLVLLSWQWANLSMGGYIWPEGWPHWPSQHEVIQLAHPEIGETSGELIGEIIDPDALSRNSIERNGQLSLADVTLPERFVMVGLHH